MESGWLLDKTGKYAALTRLAHAQKALLHEVGEEGEGGGRAQPAAQLSPGASSPRYFTLLNTPPLNGKNFGDTKLYKIFLGSPALL